MNVGAGYGTEEKARVDAEYHHVNFFGGARSAGAHVRWSWLDRGARLDFNQPYFSSGRPSRSGPKRSSGIRVSWLCVRERADLNASVIETCPAAEIRERVRHEGRPRRVVPRAAAPGAFRQADGARPDVGRDGERAVHLAELVEDPHEIVLRQPPRPRVVWV